MLQTTITKRPRNINLSRAAALLYGDLGTSKAYVIGLAFAAVGYASFWLIIAVCCLLILIGLNYVLVCKYYPNGGGVYASTCERSEVVALIGSFFLIVDYLVTAAISALSAFIYFGVDDPVLCAMAAILLIGCINYFGPKLAGRVAVVIGYATVATFLLLTVVSVPHLAEGFRNLKPLTGGVIKNWEAFVGVIVALSGIETIANITGIMRLNRPLHPNQPRVTHISTPAILLVIFQVAAFTTIFSLAISSIQGFQLEGGTVEAANGIEVRDSMLRYLGETLGSRLFGGFVGQIFGFVLGGVIGMLLLSAVNTAIVGLSSLQYVMASDGMIPRFFQRLNRYGVPLFPLLIATVIPMLIIATIHNIARLADLYAIGFVGAIATNLGAMATNFKLDLRLKERVFLFFSALIMFVIEISLFIEKSHARTFLVTTILIGMILRALTKEYKENKEEAVEGLLVSTDQDAIFCAVQHEGRALDYAIERATRLKRPLHVLFVKEQEVITRRDLKRMAQDDPEANQLQKSLKKRLSRNLLHFHYTVSDAPANTIAEYAIKLQVPQLIVGLPRGRGVQQLFSRNLLRDLMKILPENLLLLVIG